MLADNKEKVKKTIRVFFDSMGFPVEILELKAEGETLSVKMKTDEPGVLIGQNGQTLFEIQALLRAMIRRKITESFFLDIDINDYKKKKTEYLEETAKSMADEVSLTKKEKALPPMSSYERRVVHLVLSDRTDVLTESIGEGPERRIVIKPK